MQSLYRTILGVSTLAAVVLVSVLVPLEGALIIIPSLIVVAREIDHQITNGNSNSGSPPPAAIALLLFALAAGTALGIAGCGSPQSPPADGEPASGDTWFDRAIDLEITGSQIGVNPEAQIVAIELGFTIHNLPVVIEGVWNYQSRVVQVCVVSPFLPKGRLCRTWNADAPDNDNNRAPSINSISWPGI